MSESNCSFASLQIDTNDVPLFICIAICPHHPFPSPWESHGGNKECCLKYRSSEGRVSVFVLQQREMYQCFFFAPVLFLPSGPLLCCHRLLFLTRK